MSKRFSVILVTLLLVGSLLSAQTTINLGQTDIENSISGLLEGTATSDGTFSLSFSPDLSFNKFSFQLDIKVKGTYATDPFGLDFDFSHWQPPVREEGQTDKEYRTAVLKQYSSLVRYAQWGQRYETVYIRYGKLSGITLGDGAILNGYFDKGVSVRASRPGLDIMLDGLILDIPNAGFEFITNDIFEPTLLVWRIYARPLYQYEKFTTLSRIEVGVSYAENPTSTYEPVENMDDLAQHNRKLMNIDLSIPMIDWEYLNLAFFTNMLLQTPDLYEKQPGFALRYGLWGHSKSLIVFNASLTIPTFGIYYADYFESGFESLTYEGLNNSIITLGTTRIDALMALNFSNAGAYLRGRIRSDYKDGEYSNYRFMANARIDKRLFNIVSLDLSYEKLYPTNTGERFFKGLSTLRNVEIAATAIVKVKPYSFDIGLSMVFDDEAQSTLQVDTAVRISIL